MRVYFPLSQVQTNLYTNGDEYTLVSNYDEYNPNATPPSYIGPFFKTSDGKQYTEEFPIQESEELLELHPATGKVIPPSDERVILPNLDKRDSVNFVNSPSITDAPVYNDFPLNNSTYPLSSTSDEDGRGIPSMYFPVLTSDQIQNGKFTRYFAKKRNELKYQEISKESYTSLQSPNSGMATDLYSSLFLTWKIVGDKSEVFKQNEDEVKLKSKENRWPGFSKYFKNKFNQFFQESVIRENLYTNGGEFTTPDGKEYIGLYHLHPDKGPMVGAVHKKTKHDILIPIESQPTTRITQPSPPPSPSTPNVSGGGY